MQMLRATVKPGADLAGFREAVRNLVAHRAPPPAVLWTAGAEPDFFGLDMPCRNATDAKQAPPVALPRAVTELIELVICHRDPERFALLYALIWRVLHGERALLDVQSDALVHRLEMLRKAVRRDLHKMHAFLRFRETSVPACGFDSPPGAGGPSGGQRYIAWYEPDHYILEAVAPFFVERFESLAWSILTPQGSLHWDGSTLTLGPPARRSDAPDGDAFEGAWRAYYESVFNPARVNPAAMRQHMPKKFWRNLPEAQAIPELVRGAPSRLREMIEREAAMPARRNPDKAVAAMARQEPQTLEELNRQIAASAPLTPGADHAVLGEGAKGAEIAFVGEQPGDQEDREGRPFVGPAGQLLDRALAEVGIDREKVYVTNAVKHFKYEQRGKRRLHKKPDAGEVKRYRWWLERELHFVHPRVVVALGGTALLALTGKPLSVLRSRGPLSFGDLSGYATVHPSYLLRLPDEEARHAAYKAFKEDLRRVKKLAAT